KLWLIGYGLDEVVFEFRQELGAMLVWQNEELLVEDFAVWLRLRDDRVNTWAQEDRWWLNPAGAATSAWAEAETGREHFLLALPPGIPPGTYELVATLYDKDTLQPVVVLDAAGQAAGTEHVVATVQVASPTILPALQELS